jgi:hypothetical protein
MTPEGKVKKALDAELKRMGAYNFAPVQKGFGQRTIDRLACVGGRFWGIECKAGSEQPTALQRECLRQIKAAGGCAAVVHLDENNVLVWEFL